jgi:predicted 3-demethylubiquinone-9 3-methyltransferase (glyoxalase superfamily)
MSAKIQPFLMFQGNAEEAMNFYLVVFPDAAIDHVQRYGPGQNAREGSIMLAAFSIGGQSVLCTDSPVAHNFTFTPAFSFFVTCESGDAQEDAFAALSDGGSVLMPLDNYGFSSRFGWVNDRFGVSWQLNLP